MQEIEKGIYRYDGELNTCNEEPLILMHPWHDEGKNNFKLYHGNEISTSLKDLGYLKNLERLLKESCKRNVVLFEGVPFNYSQLQLRDFSQEKLLKNFMNSWKRIINLRGDKGLYGIVTYQKSSVPFFSSWDFKKREYITISNPWLIIFNFIRGLSNNLEVAGGYIKDPAPLGFNSLGCLESFCRKARKNKFKVKLAKGGCFTF